MENNKNNFTFTENRIKWALSRHQNGLATVWQHLATHGSTSDYKITEIVKTFTKYNIVK